MVMTEVMTDTITVHSPGLCAQLLNNGPEQHADIPLERKAEKVHSLSTTITSLEVVNICRCYQPKDLNRVALHIWM